MDTLGVLATALAAVSVSLIGYGAWSLATAEKARVAWRVSRTGIGIRRRPESAADVRVHGRSNAVFAPVDRTLSKFGWAERSRLELEKAEISLHLSEFILIRVGATALVFAVVWMIGGSFIFLLAGLGAAAVVWWQSGAYVRRRLNRRRQAIEAQLDRALVNLSGSLRAGFSFLQACQMSVNQLEWPLQGEMREMLEEVNVGASIDEALRNLANRIESYEVDIAVNAVLVQRQVGGSLAEILDNVAKTIRERRELRGHIMALTAQQRLSAIFVALVPVFMAVFLSLTSWQFMKPLYLTVTGNVLMAVGVVLDVLGFLVMRRLTKIDF